MTIGSVYLFSSRFRTLTLAVALLAAPTLRAESDRYPTEPNESITPGELCARADSYRYPERISYCERSVSTGLKNEIIRQYDSQFGYEIGRMDRADFKIDHFIPLCMGGSNTRGNLWPQHKSVFGHTDPIEQGLCQLMAEGRLSQSEAVTMIRDVKHHLDRSGDMMTEIRRRLHE